MTRGRRVLLSAAIGLAGLVLLLFVSAILVARSDWFAEQVRQRIVLEVEQATGGRAEIGEFRFDWKRLRAVVRPFVLHGKEGPGEAPLFRADSIEVGLRIVSLLRRDIDIASLTVSVPRVRVIVYPDGTSNLPQPMAARKPRRPVEEILALAIGTFRVENGLVEVAARQIPIDARGENLNVRMVYESGVPRYSGEVSFRKLQLASAAIKPVALSASLSLTVEADRLLIRAANVSTGKSSAQATGTVENLTAPRCSLSFSAKLSLAELQTIAKLAAAVQGVMNLSGKLSYAGPADYAVTARASSAGVALRLDGGGATNIRFTSGVEARPGTVEFRDLSAGVFGGSFSGRADLRDGRRFRLAGDLKDASLTEIARLRGIEKGDWGGSVSGPLEIEGALTGSKTSGVKANAKLAVKATASKEPVDGLIEVSFDQSAGTLELGDSYLATPSSRLRFRGALERRLQVEAESTNLNDTLQVASLLSAHLPKSLPVALKGGSAKFSGTLQGKLEAPQASGHLAVSKLEWNRRLVDRLDSDVSLSQSSFRADNLTAQEGTARLEGSGHVELSNWEPSRTGEIQGAFTLRGLALEKELPKAAMNIPVRGTASGEFRIAGSIGAPEVTGQLALTKAEAFRQRLDQAVAQFRYAGNSVSLDSFQLSSGTARVHGSAVYTHVARDWQSGDLRFELSSQAIPLAQIRDVGLPPEVDGILDLQLRGTASIRGEPVLTGLWGNVALRSVAVGKLPVGRLVASVDTQARALTLKLVGDMTGAAITGQVQCQLQGKYPLQGEVSFTGLALSALWPWLTPLTGGAARPLEASAEGKVALTGSLLEASAWKARVEMQRLEILPPPDLKPQGLGLRNVGPVVLAVSRKEIRVESARFTGPDTSLEASGRIGFDPRTSTYDFRVRGSVNLAVLHNFEPNLTASGESTLDATIRGPLSKPELYGQLDLRKGSFYLSGIPNGIDNVNGVVLLSRDRATVNNVTAETGGGKLALSGFVGFGGGRLTYRLQAAAKQVRVRYPQGVSTTVDAAVNLTGTATHSVLSGGVTVLRSAVSPGIDLAALGTRSSQPIAAPSSENELLRGMQFDVRVVSAPNARFETSLTRDIQAEADLRLRGTPYKPILLGRMVVNHGEVEFFGTRYTITRGEVSFLNPARLEPVVNWDLDTRVRGIDVTMNFSGPLDQRLRATYRSDPPLQPAEIVALLAVGETPSSDNSQLGLQSEQLLNSPQLGASSLLGQALAQPVTGRLQRLFGVSRIQINPRVTGLGNNPEAQLTLEQQISRDITFTYVTSLAQEQQQLVRVEWNVSRQWSVLAVREANGLFGIEFQFKKQFK